jgi:hypothetical protein
MPISLASVPAWRTARQMRGEPEAIGKLCRFLSAVYTDPEYDSPLLGGIRKSIEDVSVRVEFSKQMEA